MAVAVTCCHYDSDDFCWWINAEKYGIRRLLQLVIVFAKSDYTNYHFKFYSYSDHWWQDNRQKIRMSHFYYPSAIRILLWIVLDKKYQLLAVFVCFVCAGFQRDISVDTINGFLAISIFYLSISNSSDSDIDCLTNCVCGCITSLCRLSFVNLLSTKIRFSPIVCGRRAQKKKLKKRIFFHACNDVLKIWAFLFIADQTFSVWETVNLEHEPCMHDRIKDSSRCSASLQVLSCHINHKTNTTHTHRELTLFVSVRTRRRSWHELLFVWWLSWKSSYCRSDNCRL